MVNCLLVLSQMNLTPLTPFLSHANLGVNPGGVVETELELNWQLVVTLVVWSTKVKLYAVNEAAGPVSFDLAVKSLIWKPGGRLQLLWL